MTIYAEFEGSLQALVGLKVSHPWLGYGSALFLELGKLTEIQGRNRKFPEGEAFIGIEWDWRVEQGSTVEFGSSDSRPTIVAGLDRISDDKITRLEVHGEVPELSLHLSSDRRLRSMAMTEGDPRWSVRLLDGRYLHARNGQVELANTIDTLSKEEEEYFGRAELSANRWGLPRIADCESYCQNCQLFIRLDGNGHYLDYGCCSAPGGPYDGRVVHVRSGCNAFQPKRDA